MWFTLFILSAVLSLGGHFILCRLPLQVNRMVKFLIAAVPIGALLAVTEFRFYGLSEKALAGIFIYVFFSELYIFVFTAICGSVSIRLLLTIRSGADTRAAVDERFSTAATVKWRLDGLVREGFLVPSASGYLVTPRGAAFARAFAALRGFFCQDRFPLSAPRSSKL